MLYYPSGIRGDRGPSLSGLGRTQSRDRVGCHYFTGNQEMDSGDIWAEEFFTMRNVRKSSLYRNEVTQAAVKAVLSAVEKFCTKSYRPGLITMIQKRVADQTLMTQNDRKINWAQDTTQDIVKTQFGRWSSGYFEYGLEKMCISSTEFHLANLRPGPVSLVLLSVGTKTVFCLPQAMERSGLLIYVKNLLPTSNFLLLKFCKAI